MELKNSVTLESRFPKSRQPVSTHSQLKKRKSDGIIALNPKKRHLNPRNDDSSDDDDDEDDPNKLQSMVKSKLGDLFSKGIDHSKGQFNHIYFDKNVTTFSCRELISKIEALNIKIGKLVCDYEMTEPPKIHLHINSYGGSIFAAFSVIDTIRRSKFPIVTIIDGAAASAATLISIFGHERQMTKHSYMLIHQLSSACWGTMAEIDDEHANLTELMERIYVLYEDKTLIKKSELKKLLKHDRWWNAETCLKRGLIDEII